MTLMTFDDLDDYKSKPQSKKEKAKESKQKRKKSPERFGEVSNISGASSQPKVK
jgi:hypothetical protein